MRSTILLSFLLLLPGSITASETYCDVGPYGKTGKSAPLTIPTLRPSTGPSGRWAKQVAPRSDSEDDPAIAFLRCRVPRADKERPYRLEAIIMRTDVEA
jgi:hypothetical protein